MRRATVALHITCRVWATGVATGERGDTETVTPRSERGDWKRAMIRWYLASRLLNLGHLFTELDILCFIERAFLPKHTIGTYNLYGLESLAVLSFYRHK